MDQDLDGYPPEQVEGAQQVEGGRSIETEDHLPSVQHYEGLGDGRERVNQADNKRERDE